MHSRRLSVVSLLGFVFVLLGGRGQATGQETLPVLLPLVNVPGTMVSSVIVQGRLVMSGIALVDTPVEVQRCDGIDETLFGARTDGDGNFSIDVPLASGELSASMKINYPATGILPVRGSINSFQSVCAESQGGLVQLPTVDVAGLEMTGPGKGPVIDMPILFEWQVRTNPGPNEMYQIVGDIQYDCESCEVVAVQAAALPHPSSGIELACVYSQAGRHGDIVSGNFRIMVSNDTGIGYSEWRTIAVGVTIRC